LTVTQIYADMAGVVGGGEKNEIADAHLLKCNRLALSHLLTGGAWKINPEHVSVNRLDETRAIDTIAIISTQAVSGTQPTAVFLPEHNFDVRMVSEGGFFFRCTGVMSAGSATGPWWRCAQIF